MINNLSIAVHAFVRFMLTSLSVDEMLLLRYVNWSINFRGLLLKQPCPGFELLLSILISITIIIMLCVPSRYTKSTDPSFFCHWNKTEMTIISFDRANFQLLNTIFSTQSSALAKHFFQLWTWSCIKKVPPNVMFPFYVAPWFIIN